MFGKTKKSQKVDFGMLIESVETYLNTVIDPKMN